MLYSFDKNKGFFYVDVTLKKHESNEELKKTVDKVFFEVKAILKKIAELVPVSLLEGTKASFINEVFKEQESFMELAYGNAYSFEHVGNLNYKAIYLNEIKKLKLEDLLMVAEKYFLKQSHKLFLLLPLENFAKGRIFPNSKTVKNLSSLEKRLLTTLVKDKESQAPEKAIVPSLKKSEAFEEIIHFNEGVIVTKKKLPNHTKLILAHQPHYPLMSAVLRVRGGQCFEGLKATDKLPNGVFQLLAKVLFTSNREYSKKSMMNLFRENALHFFSYSRESSLSIGFTCHQEKYSLAVDVLQSMFSNEQFSLKEFNFEKKNQLFEIAKNQERPENLARLAFKKKFFKNMIYGLPQLGTKASVEKIKVDHLNELLKDVKVEKKAYAMTVPWGKKSQEVAKTEHWLKGLNTEEKFENTSVAVPELTYNGQRSIHFRHMKNIVETYVHMGYFAPPMFSQDEAAFKIIDHYLSGIGGPIFKLRSEGYEKNGKKMGGRAYTIGVHYQPSIHYGALVFYASLGQLSKGEYEWLIAAFQKEIASIKKTGIAPEEIDRAKIALSNQFYKISLKHREKMGLYSLFELHGHSYTQWERGFKRMLSLKPSDVQRAANRYLEENNFLVHVTTS